MVTRIISSYKESAKIYHFVLVFNDMYKKINCDAM